MGRMRRRASGVLAVAVMLFSGAGVAGSEEPPQAPSLQEQIQTYETLGTQIAAVRQRLAAASGRQRRPLEAQLQQLQAAQDRAFEAIERVVGPLPPAVRHEPTIPLEDQLRNRHQRDDAVLERDVDRRLPRN